MITTVFLDIDNTLLDFGRCAADSIQKGFAEWQMPYDEAVLPVFRRINNSLWARIEDGTLTREELLQIRWQMVFDEMQIDCCGRDFEQVFIRYLTQSHEEVPGASELLRYLSQKYTLCAASNAPHRQQVIRLEKAGFLPYFTEIFTSERLGASKPNRAFFDACFAQLPGVSKDEVIMIGDSLSADIDAGKAYGLRTIWFNQDKEDTAAASQADFIVESLTVIKKIL